jgi:hypothetical protein
MWGLGQHTLLGIVVGLRVALGNTLYWVLLLVHMGSRATHFTGYCFLVYVGLWQHTLLGIVVGLCVASGNTLYWVLLLVYVGPWATHFTGSDVDFRISSETAEVNNTRHKQNHMPLLPYFLINLLYKLATIRQTSYSQTCTFPQSSPEDGNILVFYDYILFCNVLCHKKLECIHEMMSAETAAQMFILGLATTCTVTCDQID